jgi:ferredoxin-NADP reductase
MARTALPGRLTWRVATVAALSDETPRVRTLELDVPEWPGHEAGQHVDVRLTAEDGYQAQRSYSIASAPEAGKIALTVERLDDGEVSPYLTEELRPGDGVEVRGPIGGYFSWRPSDGGPLLLVGGGSGIVPLMAMCRHAAAEAASTPIRLLASWPSPDDVIYMRELGELPIEVFHTYTRSAPTGWQGYARRVDAQMLRDVAWPADAGGTTFVCGPTGFVESVADDLVGLGHDPGSIRTERFGPTGG